MRKQNYTRRVKEILKQRTKEKHRYERVDLLELSAGLAQTEDDKEHCCFTPWCLWESVIPPGRHLSLPHQHQWRRALGQGSESNSRAAATQKKKPAAVSLWRNVGVSVKWCNSELEKSAEIILPFLLFYAANSTRGSKTKRASAITSIFVEHRERERERCGRRVKQLANVPAWCRAQTKHMSQLKWRKRTCN